VNFKHARGTINIQSNFQHSIKVNILRWDKPNCDYFKLNTDATFSPNNRASFGGLLRNHIGKMIFYYWGPIVVSSPLEAEFFAMLIGCRIYNMLGMDFSHLILENDNCTLIKAIHAENCPIFKHTKHWLELLNYTKHLHLLKYTFRESNAVVDCLAKQGNTIGMFTLSFSMNSLNNICRSLILLDQWELPYIKVSINS
jgi:hypothetical protein